DVGSAQHSYGAIGRDRANHRTSRTEGQVDVVSDIGGGVGHNIVGGIRIARVESATEVEARAIRAVRSSDTLRSLSTLRSGCTRCARQPLWTLCARLSLRAGRTLRPGWACCTGQAHRSLRTNGTIG